MNSLNQIAVPFHSAELYLVEHNGQPYTPMKPIVEGMGLAWQSQLAKFNSNAQRWGITKIVIPTLGDVQEMVCLPLRKLFAWLMTISPNKVKPELRDTVIMYQNECDDVLWDYWMKGQAINNRHTISPEQQAELHEIVEQRANGFRKAKTEMWARHNRHFKIAKYSQLLSIHFEEAKQYLIDIDLKAKPEKSNEVVALEKLQSFVDNLADRYPTLQNPVAHEIAIKFSEMLRYQDLRDERLFYTVCIISGKVVVMPHSAHYGGIDLVKLAEAFEPLHNFMVGNEISSRARALKKLPLKSVPR